MKVVVVVFLIMLCTLSIAQKKNAVTITTSYTRFDVFTAFSYQKTVNKFNFGIETGIGVNSVFFTGIGFYRIRPFVSFSLLELNKVKLNVESAYAFSVLKVSNVKEFYNAFNVGYKLRFGKKYFIEQAGGIGLGKYLSSAGLRSNYGSYNLSIGLGYAF